MSTSPLNNLSSGSLQSILTNAVQNSGLGTSQTTSLTFTPPSDNGQISPFAKLLSELQQLQQNDPTKYQQVTQQIATNLQNAAQTAQSQGNTTVANQLTQLSTDFTNASQNGQLPNIQDLAQAIGGGHHHGHHHHAAAADADGGSSSSASPSTSSNTTNSGPSTESLSQLLASFLANGGQTGQSNSLDPGAIILNTLAQAGVGIGTNGINS